MNWNEESVNLNLFEELEEIEYTPPASPKRPINHFISEIPTQTYSGVQIHHLNSPASESCTDINALTAEFQAILDSLPKDSDNTEALSQVLEIAGIKTTIIGGEALVPIELDLSSITHSEDMSSLEMEVDDLNVHVLNDDSDIIEESELYGMSDMSNHGSPASSVYSTYELMGVESDEVDEHSETAQKILDALLLGDVDTAETFLPSIIDESSSSSEDSSSSFQPQQQSPAVASTSTAVEAKKPERR